MLRLRLRLRRGLGRVALRSFAAAIETGIVVVEDRKRREKYMWWGRFEQMREEGCFG